MEPHDALAYVESFLTEPAVQLGLSRVERLDKVRGHIPRVRYALHALGNPHKRYHLLHVAGTSGKGSTSALLASILQVAGYTTGLYTTPYLQDPLEKLVVNGRRIAPQVFADFIAAQQPTLESVKATSPVGPPGYSEVWTALALAYFASAQVDFAVIETVMGGRYDSTNVIDPLVAVITTVNYDHTEVLGDTLAEIAWHKAGIIKKGIPAVTAVSQPEALAVLRTECEHQAAPLFEAGRDTSYSVNRLDMDGGWFDFCGLDRWPNLHVSMLGAHQVANAATAVTAIQTLRRFWQIDVPEQAIREGLAQARFPGRLEIMQRNPLVVIDGAHNPEKIAKLRLALQELFPGKRLVLVLGVIAAKDFAHIVPLIAPLADRIITTTARAPGKTPLDPAELARFICAQGYAAECAPEPPQAVERAVALAQPDDLVCVTGSLYLVGQARTLWYSSDQVSPKGSEQNFGKRLVVK